MVTDLDQVPLPPPSGGICENNCFRFFLQFGGQQRIFLVSTERHPARVSAKILHLLNTLMRPKKKPLQEYYEDEDAELERTSSLSLILCRPGIYHPYLIHSGGKGGRPECAKAGRLYRAAVLRREADGKES